MTHEVGIAIGLALMVLGIALFLLGRSKSKEKRVHASNGSIAVGGKNTGSITNLNIGGSEDTAHGAHGLTKLSIFVEFIGISVTIWHAWHLASI